MDICFDYKLDPLSVVFDVGGYHGEFTEWIRNKYGCGVHIFEPCRDNFKIIIEKFRLDPMVWPYSVALEDRDENDVEINIADNSSSLYHEGQSKELIRVRDIVKFIEAFKLPKIELIKMNCEGSEYKILNRLFEKNWIPKIQMMVIQFHSVPGYDKQDFENRLSQTHYTEHKCDYWEFWRIKP